MVALVGSLPVDVLMKSAPAIMQARDAWYTWLYVGSSPVAKMVFMWACHRRTRRCVSHGSHERTTQRSTHGSAGFLEQLDLVVHCLPVACQREATADDDVDFPRAVVDSSTDFVQLLRQRDLARGEARGNGCHRDARALKITSHHTT